MTKQQIIENQFVIHPIKEQQLKQSKLNQHGVNIIQKTKINHITITVMIRLQHG